MENLSAQLDQWNYWVSLAATVAFAVTGVLAITEDSDCDLLGAIVFGVIAGIGGGTIRDVILGRPPVWASDQSLVAIAVVAAVIAFYGRRQIIERGIYSALNYLDGFGAAMFAVQSTGMVWHLDYARPTGPIILGVLTAIGGGLLRDVLAGRPTLLMRRELYATPLVMGSLASAFILWLAPETWKVSSLICIGCTFAVRAAAIHWELSLPDWAKSARASEAKT